MKVFLIDQSSFWSGLAGSQEAMVCAAHYAVEIRCPLDILL